MTDSTPPRRLLLGTAGWVRPDWVADYYPPDLPADWRLGYYANDCDCVLLTRADLEGLDVELLADMLSETPDGFRCFIETGAELQSDALSGLRDEPRCVQLVDDANPGGGLPVQWAALGDGIWQAPDGGARLVRWSVDGDDLRALRTRAETLDAAAVALVIDGPRADPGRIGELRTLLELMGRA